MSVVSAGIAGIGAASIKAFTELDEGYDTIVTKTGATGEALEGLTKSADNVFGTMPEDMSTVGEAIGEVNTRFHTTGTELEKTSKQFIQFATINGTNVTQSVDQVDKIMKAWNVDASQTGNLLGLLTAKAQETGISVDTLEGYVLDNNAQFKEMGLSLPQAINLMAQFDANGVDSTQAMAGLKKALQNATSEGKSMDEALSDTIGSIKNAKTETEAMQIATELFGKKGAAEMTKAIRENRIDLTSLSSSMEEYGSTVEDTYNGTLDPIDNAKVAMNNAKLALSTLASTAQTSAAPMIEKLTGKIQELTQWFTSLSPAQQETVAELRSATSCFETVLKFFDCHFPLIFWAFLPFRFSVVLFLNHKNRCFLLLRFKLQSLKNVSHNTIILKQSNDVGHNQVDEVDQPHQSKHRANHSSNQQDNIFYTGNS